MSLEFPESQSIAARYVREAIPMMVGKKIVPNPLNFALWYAYVSNRSHDLKADLDGTIELHGTCPEEESLNLFRRHIINDEVLFQQNLEDSLTELVDDLLEDVGQSKEITEVCSQNYQKNIALMNKEQTTEELRQMTVELAETTGKANQLVDDLGTQLRSAEEEIRLLKKQLEIKDEQAYVDPLTNIGNRRFFERKLFELFADDSRIFSLIFVDLDHFKQLNDKHGHLLGDKVLQAVGKVLSQCMPETASVARYGGEEFVVLLEEGIEPAANLAEGIRKQLEKICLRSKKDSGHVNTVTASFGVAQRVPDEFPDQLIERADEALYHAKASGRNRVERERHGVAAA